MVGLAEEALDGGAVVDDGHDDIAVVGHRLLLHNHVVAIVDAGLDHGLAAHREHEGGGIADDIGGQRDGVGDVLLGENRGAGSHVAHQGHIDELAVGGRESRDRGGNLLDGIGKRDGAGFKGVALDEALVFKCLQMDMDGGRGGEPQTLAHLAHRRTVALLANARFDAVENRLLPLGHFLGHSASFHKSVHLFEKSLDVNLCSLYYNCEQRFYARGQE